MKFDKNLEAPYHMSLLFYLELNKLIARKDEAYIGGDLLGWYKGLRAIKRKIIFKLKEHKDYGLVKEKLEAAAKLINSEAPNQLEASLSKIINSRLPNLLEDIDELLTNVMDYYNMIFPPVQIKGLESIARRYGLE